MQILKISAFVLVAATATTVAFGQKSGNTSKRTTAKPTASKTPHSVSSASKTPILSANPLTGEGLEEWKAEYAPAFAFTKQARDLFASDDLAGAESACYNALSAAPIIQGKKQPVPFVPLLLGQIYLKAGENKKAVYWLQGAHQNSWSSSLNLDLALAYIRLGDYKNALRHYSDTAITQYNSAGYNAPRHDILPQDLPGTGSPSTLEASILLARGMDADVEDRTNDALSDFQKASQLAPDNAVVAFHYGSALKWKRRYSEAIPYLQRATTGRSFIGENAKHDLSVLQNVLAAEKLKKH